MNNIHEHAPRALIIDPMTGLMPSPLDPVKPDKIGQVCSRMLTRIKAAKHPFPTFWVVDHDDPDKKLKPLQTNAKTTDCTAVR